VDVSDDGDGDTACRVIIAEPGVPGSLPLLPLLLLFTNGINGGKSSEDGDDDGLIKAGSDENPARPLE